jgi:hypothetical protein
MFDFKKGGVMMTTVRPKGSRKNNFQFLTADASCLAVFRKLEIS